MRGIALIGFKGVGRPTQSRLTIPPGLARRGERDCGDAPLANCETTAALLAKTRIRCRESIAVREVAWIIRRRAARLGESSGCTTR
jgi:hypothetical protein